MAENVTTTELEVALQQLAEQMGLSTVEYVQSLGYETVAEVQAKVDTLQGQIDAIVTIDAEDGIETLAEKIELLNTALNSEEGASEAILTRLTTAENDIDALEAQITILQDSALKASTLDICLIANSFRSGLNLDLVACTENTEGEDPEGEDPDETGTGTGTGGEGEDPEGDGLVI